MKEPPPGSNLAKTCYINRLIFMGGSETEPLRLEVDPRDGTITVWINSLHHDSVRSYIEGRIDSAKAESRLASAHYKFRNGFSQVHSCSKCKCTITITP